MLGARNDHEMCAFIVYCFITVFIAVSFWVVHCSVMIVSDPFCAGLPCYMYAFLQNDVHL